MGAGRVHAGGGLASRDGWWAERHKRPTRGTRGFKGHEVVRGWWW